MSRKLAFSAVPAPIWRVKEPDEPAIAEKTMKSSFTPGFTGFSDAFTLPVKATEKQSARCPRLRQLLHSGSGNRGGRGRITGHIRQVERARIEKVDVVRFRRKREIRSEADATAMNFLGEDLIMLFP